MSSSCQVGLSAEWPVRKGQTYPPIPVLPSNHVPDLTNSISRTKLIQELGFIWSAPNHVSGSLRSYPVNVTKPRYTARDPPVGAMRLNFLPQSELNTHSGMKLASSAEKSVTSKRDVQLLSKRKGAKAGCPAGESVSPQAHQAARARATWLQRKNPERCRAMQC